MRKLTAAYWDKLLITNKNGKTVRDGIFFEDLVEELLQLEYPSTWIRTKKSHDCNRDFHIFTEDKKIWVECKNYSCDIALDTIAPTLVMAHIFMVNKIIFFSYSAINSHARRKIYAFASRADKEIYIIDEILLDELIISHKENLSTKFRPTAVEIIEGGCERDCQIDFFFVQNPIIGATLEDRNIIPVNDVNKIFYNCVFEIVIFCEPYSLTGNFNLSVSTENSDREVNEYFEVIDNDLSDLSHLKLNIPFTAGSGCVCRILLKPRRFKNPLTLPIFKTEISDGEKILITKKSMHKVVKNEWIGQTILIGEHYRNIVLNIEQRILQNNRISCFVISGNSGTGKTRLLKETLEKLLKHKYKIASFIGNENDSAQTIIKEIIYFIFEVPRKEIFEYLETQTNEPFEKNEQTESQFKAYELAKKIGNNLSDSEVIQLIDEYFAVLYEKISSEPIAIVIDNLQFFGAPLIYFLQQYLDYSKHQTRYNRSVLVLSVNSDYMNNDIYNFMEYIKELEKDRPEFLSKEIRGFEDINQAVVFLRELLNIKNEHSDAQLEMLAKKASLIPYYIHQAVYSLIDENIVRYHHGERGFIANMPKFYQAVDTLPQTIHKILKKRWDFLIDKNNLNEVDCKAVCSLNSIIGPFDDKIVDKFQLDDRCIQILVKHNFLRKNEGTYFFDHDIIEAFFLNEFKTRYYKIFDHIKSKNLQSEMIDYPFLNYFYQIKEMKLSASTLERIVEYACVHHPSYKISEDFFSQLIKVLKKYREDFSSYEKWLDIINKACNSLRNIIGFKKTVLYYQSINDTIDEVGIHKFIQSSGFRNYINTYTDILHHMQRGEESIAFLTYILNYVQYDVDDDQYNALKSMIYNRLMINYREYESPYHIKKRDESLAQSILYAKKIKDKNLRDEFIYLNLSDEGYLYYALEKDRDKLLAVWEKCKQYSPDRLPQKTLNYYRKMIQLNLIYGNIKETELFIDKMQGYIKERAYTSEQIVFLLFALTAKTMCLLMDNPTEHYSELIQNINDLMLLSKLKGGKKVYNILNLKAIIAYYNGDIAGMIESFNEAYHAIKHIESTMHLQEQIELLQDNIICAFVDYGYQEKINDILFDKSPDFVNQQCRTYANKKHYARGILHTFDFKFNLPLVV